MADTFAPDLPPPGAYPAPPIADYERPGEHAFTPEGPEPAPAPLPDRLSDHITAWNHVAVVVLLAVFIGGATAGGFLIAHLALAVGCFVLAGASGLVALALGYEPTPKLQPRVELLEDVAVTLLGKAGPRGRS